MKIKDDIFTKVNSDERKDVNVYQDQIRFSISNVIKLPSRMYDDEFDRTLFDQYGASHDKVLLTTWTGVISLLSFMSILVLDNMTQINEKSVTQSVIGILVSILQLYYDFQSNNRRLSLMLNSRQQYYRSKVESLIDNLRN